MTEPLVRRIPFAKIVIILASIFGVALGLCGVTAFAAGAMRGSAGNFLPIFGIIELAAILLSAIGLVFTVILWVIMSAVGNFSSENSDPPTILDSSQPGPDHADDHQ